jgi:HK97 family phage major capsid protein
MVAAADSKDVGANIDRLCEAVDKLNTVHALTVDRSKGVVSYFEESDEPTYNAAQLKSLAVPRVRHSKRMELLRASGYESQFRSMSHFLQGVAGKDSAFAAKHGTALNAMCKSLGMNTYEGESGGVLVLPEFAPAIREKSYDNVLWELTDNYVVSGNSMNFPKWRETNRTTGNRGGGLRGFWRGEEQTLAKSSPALDTTTLKANKFAVLVYITEEMLADSGYVLEQYVSRRVREEIRFALGDSIVNGTGVGMPLGYLNAPTTISIAKESGQVAGTLVGQNIIKMWARRDSSISDESFEWHVNQEIESLLPTLELGTTGNGQLVYMPAGGLSGAPYATLMGRPVRRTEFNSAAGTRGDIALVNLSNYLTINKGGVTEKMDASVGFLTDVMAYKFTIRVDGRPADDSPITPYKGSATQSSFIVLDTRA